jgi:hypothetical protein
MLRTYWQVFQQYRDSENDVGETGSDLIWSNLPSNAHVETDPYADEKVKLSGKRANQQGGRGLQHFEMAKEGRIFEHLPSNIQEVLTDYEEACRNLPESKTNHFGMGSELERVIETLSERFNQYRTAYVKEYLEWCATNPYFGDDWLEVDDTKILLYAHFHIRHRRSHSSNLHGYIATSTAMVMMGICYALYAHQVSQRQNQNTDPRQSEMLETYANVFQRYRDSELKLVQNNVERPFVSDERPVKKAKKMAETKIESKKNVRQMDTGRTTRSSSENPVNTTMKQLQQWVLALTDELKSLKQMVYQLLEQTSKPHQPKNEAPPLVKQEKSITNVHELWHKWCDAISTGPNPQLPSWSVAFMPLIRSIQEETLKSDGDISMVLNDLEWYRLRRNLSLNELVERIQTNNTILHHT